jgi:hypothetical protein
MLFRTSIVYGFARLCLLIFLIFFVNKKIFKRFKTQDFLEFIVNKWFKYGSLLLITVFVMIQLGVYSFINLLFMLFVFMLLDFIGIKNSLRPKKYLSKRLNLLSLEVLKNIENKKKLSFWLRLDKDNNLQKKDWQIISLVACITILQFLTKYYVFNFDIFSFSKLWYSNLGGIINFDSQLWFTNESEILGQSALINIYSKLVNISPEIALQSIPILENTLLCLILFWAVGKITVSPFFAPIIAISFFILAQTIIPINIEFILKNNSIFSALTLAIPLMVYVLKPELLKLNKFNYTLLLTFCFIAIGLINLVVLLICFPLFIAITLLLNCKKNNSFYPLSLLSYALGIVIILMIYALTCYHLKIDFEYFIHSNLISTHTFTYLPNLDFSYSKLMLFYQICSGIGIFIMLLLTWIKKENWKTALAFMLFFNGLVLLSRLNNNWLDTDIIITMFPVFIPITVGINAALIQKLMGSFIKEKSVLSQLIYTVIIIGFIGFLIQIQTKTLTELKVTDRTPTTVLNAYDEISETYIPYTYAVVNINSAEPISTNKHFFINYDYFLDNYPRRDSIYNKNKGNPHYFKKHPEMVLPNSIFVFVYNPDEIKSGNLVGKYNSIVTEKTNLDIDNAESLFSEGSRKTPRLLTLINNLNKKGREIHLYYHSDTVKVYEIVNVPKKSKTADLIYEK